MYEDAEIELEVFPPDARVFAIASAGCTALALARQGRKVTAVDVNPVQVDYVRSRLRSDVFVPGSAERRLGRLRRLAGIVGWSRLRLEAFCRLDDVAEQRLAWSEQLDTRRFRLALSLAFRPLSLRAAYRAGFAAALPARFDRSLRRRLERGFSTHPNCSNPYARQLLLGDPVSWPPTPSSSIDLQCSDAIEYLEQVRPASFDGFALSNILDGANVAYAERLLAAVRRAGAPGAKLVLRSLREPASPSESEWATRDRSLIWGTIRVEEAV
jgi:hypothetical protein